MFRDDEYRSGGDGLNSPRRRPVTVAEDTPYPDRYVMRRTSSLVVNRKNLTSIPDHVFQTALESNVTSVDFSWNRLRMLPKGLHIMSDYVTELSFESNILTSIPPFLSEFGRMATLNLAVNTLEDLPEEIGQLVNLKELNISRNRFEKIPTCVYQMRNLEILLAQDNRIVAIDASAEGLGGLRRLATLNLRNNNITVVPPVLGNMISLTTLDIVGNPFRQPRNQVLIKGTASILAYLRDRIPT